MPEFPERFDEDPDFHDEEMARELPSSAEAEIAALRRILARVAVLLRQGKLREALDDIPVTEHEQFAEVLMGADLPPRTSDA